MAIDQTPEIGDQIGERGSVNRGRVMWNGERRSTALKDGTKKDGTNKAVTRPIVAKSGEFSWIFLNKLEFT